MGHLPVAKQPDVSFVHEIRGIDRDRPMFLLHLGSGDQAKVSVDR
jgi:hypothetical protein